MTDHKSSEPLPTNAPRSITEPRTEASEQTPPMDAATQLASQQLIIALKCGKEVGWIVEQAVLALRELSERHRRLKAALSRGADLCERGHGHEWAEEARAALKEE